MPAQDSPCLFYTIYNGRGYKRELREEVRERETGKMPLFQLIRVTRESREIELGYSEKTNKRIRRRAPIRCEENFSFLLFCRKREGGGGGGGVTGLYFFLLKLGELKPTYYIFN